MQYSDTEIVEMLWKYYKAHQNYLNSLSYLELMKDKIYWGLEDQLLII